MSRVTLRLTALAVAATAALWAYVARPPTTRPPATLATTITPITNTSGGASGFLYAGESYEVACTVSGQVTLYPASYEAVAGWEVYQGYPCALDSAVATEGACVFPARSGAPLTWNAYKTGGGAVSACTASARSGPVPASRGRSGGGGGTVTAVTATAPLASSGGATPDISLTGVVGQARGGTAADLSSSAANKVWASPASGAPGAMLLRDMVTADLPPSGVTPGTYTNANVTVNDRGQVTSASNGGGGSTVTTLASGATITAGGMYFLPLGAFAATLDVADGTYVWLAVAESGVTVTNTTGPWRNMITGLDGGAALFVPTATLIECFRVGTRIWYVPVT